jgi:hypothetical protein
MYAISETEAAPQFVGSWTSAQLALISLCRRLNAEIDADATNPELSEAVQFR